MLRDDVGLIARGEAPSVHQVVRRQDAVNIDKRFWKAIARGVSSWDAALEAGVSQPVGTRWFRENGGMPPTNLTPLSGRYLSFAEREEIALLHAQKVGVREIARRIERASVDDLARTATECGDAQWRIRISRVDGTVARRAEIQAPEGREAGRQRGAAAGTCRSDWQARLTSGNGATVGPAVNWNGRRHGRRQDRRWATSWSPEQISARLKLDFPDDESMRVSHEAIYQALYVQGRGALRRELVTCLRTGRALRVPRARTRRGKAFVSPEVMITERPPEANDRAVPGHWEGDLILGLDSSAIGTLVERSTRFTMLLHLPRMTAFGQPRVKNGPALAGHGADAVRDAIASSIVTLPKQLRRSLTWDQGAEMAQHVQLRIKTGLPIYFCDPHSPWQRGTNENTNGLLRQYFPKGTDLSRYSGDELEAVAAALNSRPRKTLGWKTPAEALRNHLNSTTRTRVATTP